MNGVKIYHLLKKYILLSTVNLVCSSTVSTNFAVEVCFKTLIASSTFGKITFWKLPGRTFQALAGNLNCVLGAIFQPLAENLNKSLLEPSWKDFSASGWKSKKIAFWSFLTRFFSLWLKILKRKFLEPSWTAFFHAHTANLLTIAFSTLPEGIFQPQAANVKQIIFWNFPGAMFLPLTEKS